jgi:electron transfer flavoprotein alpha subunit
MQTTCSPLHCIVLVKQVPDISDLRPDAWDTDKGTLRRGVLDSILNPLDAHALNLASQIRRGEGRIIALTMGPPQAEEVLMDCLARCADDAVLLTDRFFAGADTCATAYALAHATRRIIRDFELGSNYVVVTGMQSTDGDTAQVPAQVAEELDIGQIAYAEKAEWQERLQVHRIGPLGKETVAPREYPILITATSSDVPVFRSFHRARAALQQTVTRWSAKDLDLPTERLGLSGSRTQGVRIFSPNTAQESQCRFLNDPVQLVAELRAAWQQGKRKAVKDDSSAYQLAGRKPAYTGEIWVFAEQEDGVLHPVALELLGTARRLAESLGAQVGAVLLGDKVRELSKTLIAHGADRVYLAEGPLLAEFRPVPFKIALKTAIGQHRPQIVLFGATPLGRELAPRVAYAANAGLTADCTELEIGDFERDKEIHVAVLKQTRPALGGNIMATIVTRNSDTQMATVRPAVMKALPANPNRQGEVVEFAPEVTEDHLKMDILNRQPLSHDTRLAHADIVVSGGKGLGSRESFDRFIPPLARAFGELLDAESEVGASRAAVEDGFIARHHQVGQTGQTVQPRLYVAVAISGAIQHISGMQNADLIIAINKDPHAPIFRHADFGMVGELDNLLPPLLQAIQQTDLVAS